jgi:hypothetical protein
MLYPTETRNQSLNRILLRDTATKKGNKMRIGLDLDKTITATPWMFSAMTKGLIANGHTVFIITYRDQELKEYTIKQLKELDIQYNILFLPPNRNTSPEKWKARLAKNLGLDVMFDDQVSILSSMPENIHTFLSSTPSNPSLGVYAKTDEIYDEFRLVDDTLGLPFGTIAAVIKHGVLDHLEEVQIALAKQDIEVDDKGCIPTHNQTKWIDLLRVAGMSEKWLK